MMRLCIKESKINAFVEKVNLYPTKIRAAKVAKDKRSPTIVFHR